MLKSIDRINKMIEEDKIKRIYIFDPWYKQFVKKVEELFGSKVEVYVIKNNPKAIDGISFNETDCILFNGETILLDRGKGKEVVLLAARVGKALIKVLTEDIFDVKVDKGLNVTIRLDREELCD